MPTKRIETINICVRNAKNKHETISRHQIVPKRRAVLASVTVFSSFVSSSGRNSLSCLHLLPPIQHHFAPSHKRSKRGSSHANFSLAFPRPQGHVPPRCLSPPTPLFELECSSCKHAKKPQVCPRLRSFPGLFSFVTPAQIGAFLLRPCAQLSRTFDLSLASKNPLVSPRVTF